MQEFRFLDYYTLYSCSGTFKREFKDSACFSDVFRSKINESDSVYYKIQLFTDLSKLENNNSNYCPFTKEQVISHIKKLNYFYPIRFKVTEHENYFMIYLHIKSAPLIFHKYSLTWVRYLYEFPYNMWLSDAIKLKKDSHFTFESIANIFNLICGSYCGEPREIHQIPTNSRNQRLSRKKLFNKLQKVKYLNDVYQTLSVKGKIIPQTIDKYKYADLEYWLEGFETRKEVYINNYKR